MKRRIGIIIIFSMCILTACGAGENSKNAGNQDNTDSNIPTQNTSNAVGIQDTSAGALLDVADDITSDTPSIMDQINELKVDTEVVEITEKMFLTQINDIYYNFEDYQNKTITVQGMYTTTEYEDGTVINFVYRNGPGCCGNDGWGGFLLNYDGQYPEENAWIEVTGTPELIDEEAYTDLYLNVSSLTVMDERGAEYVSQ